MGGRLGAAVVQRAAAGRAPPRWVRRWPAAGGAGLSARIPTRLRVERDDDIPLPGLETDATACGRAGGGLGLRPRAGWAIQMACRPRPDTHASWGFSSF